MKVLHLNTYAGNGGAGKACLRLSKALKSQGTDSVVAVNFLFKRNPEVHDLSRGFFFKWLTAAGIILERLLNRLFVKPVPVPFSIPFWGRDISGRELLRSADLIHIHWINHAFLRPDDIKKLSALNKPIVWTFHDSNAFTGGCHVRYNCEHYQNECGNCPVLKKSGPDDLSHSIWKRKARAYQGNKYTVIAPSKWMERSVRQSKLMGSQPAVNIPNTLDTTVFKSIDQSESRRSLGLPVSKFIMMSGFMPSRNDLHKGTSYLIEAIGIFIADHSISPEDVELVIFGNRDVSNTPVFPVKATFLGTIAAEEKLAMCYSAADVFLAPSLEDNLPYTVMESLACGTPVVGFTTGGIPDMVQHLHNGYLAEYRSATDLASGIRWVFDHPDKATLRANSRKFIEDNFSEKQVADRHIELYNSLVRENAPA
ncbi:glycosyltransferase [Daejeonella sp. JGW-45]|uniref:glycosyltransferase n=1 Tax=Daejeonella sp. JGW-45 TaxID=3034148 RepID=UPI0023ECC34D|nr:glycosyltransferase [Daejeonella sp. JGW-45]